VEIKALSQISQIALSPEFKTRQLVTAIEARTHFSLSSETIYKGLHYLHKVFELASKYWQSLGAVLASLQSPLSYSGR